MKYGKNMGSPQNPTPEQVAGLEKAGQLQRMGKIEKIKTKSGKVILYISLPRQGISLLKLDW